MELLEDQAKQGRFAQFRGRAPRLAVEVYPTVAAKLRAVGGASALIFAFRMICVMVVVRVRVARMRCPWQFQQSRQLELL